MRKRRIKTSNMPARKRSYSKKPQTKMARKKRKYSLSASGNTKSIVMMAGKALIGGIVGGVIARRINFSGQNQMTSNLIKGAIGVGGVYVLITQVKDPIFAAGFAAGYGSQVVSEANIPFLSELADYQSAEFVNDDLLADDTLILNDDGNLISMDELMEGSDYGTFAEEFMSEEDIYMSELQDLQARSGRGGKLLNKVPQVQALKYIYPRSQRFF
jgi:hypothetical protein